MIDRDIQAFVERSDCFASPAATDVSLSGQRGEYEAYARAFAVRRPVGVTSREGMLVAADRAIPLRLYTPAGEAAHGLVLYAHGGGFTLGSLDSHDGIVARVAAETGALVIAIDYRLTPEHPVAAAVEDVLEVIVAAEHGRLPWPGLPQSGLGLMGDSAGATLMAAAALRVGGDRPGALAALALIYPMLGYEPAEPARSEEADAPMLTLADIVAYRAVAMAGRDPPPGLFVLDEADLSPLPPTLLLPAEHDPLRDDCTVLARRLRQRGTDVVLLPGTGWVHGCLRALDSALAVGEPFAQLCAGLMRHLSPP